MRGVLKWHCNAAETGNLRLTRETPPFAGASKALRWSLASQRVVLRGYLRRSFYGLPAGFPF